MSKTFTYIGTKNMRLDPKTGEHVEIIPRFRGHDFPKGKPVVVTDPVTIAKLSVNPDFEEVKGGKGKTDKSDKNDGKGGDGAGNQPGATGTPAA